MDKDDKMMLERVLHALAKVYANDYFLIENKCHELAIVGAFYRYFSNMYRAWFRKMYPEVSIDMEYSRMGEEMCAKPAPPNSHSKNHMRIDFVIHERKSQAQNILAIEFKLDGRNKDIDWDYEKLSAMTIKSKDDNQVRNYGLGISIVLEPNGLVVRCFKDGSGNGGNVKYKWDGSGFVLNNTLVHIGR